MRTYFLTFVHHLFKTITLWAILHSINTCSCRSVFSSVSTFPSGWDNEARVACSCSSQSSNTCKALWYSWWTSTSPLALLTAFCNKTDWRHEWKEAVYPFSITGAVDSVIMCYNHTGHFDYLKLPKPKRLLCLEKYDYSQDYRFQTKTELNYILKHMSSWNVCNVLIICKSVNKTLKLL